MNEFFTDYSEYMSGIFPGVKVQKISVNAGFCCPNRDGTIGTGGCIYCNNRSFTPAYCFGTEGVAPQLEAGKKFFARKYPEMKYIAYFQSYTNTYRASAAELRRIYEEALGVDGVVGLAVATRPDTLPEETLDLLSYINQTCPVFVELGVESLCDTTLKTINRGHDSAAAEDAVLRLADAGLHVGVHLIAGLPGETDETVLETVRRVCSLPVDSIKMHHLQVLKGTPLCRMVENGELRVPRYTPESYLDLCVRIVGEVPRHIAIERFLASSPPAEVVSPHWGLKNHEFVNRLINELKNIKL